MKRIIRNVFLTCDARTFRHFFGDEILNADPVPKLLLMPMTWRGDLKPVLDAYLEQLAPLSNGLTLGRTLSAEEIPAVLDLGTQWLGGFAERMLAARDESPGAVEATPVLEALEAVRREMKVGNRQRVADGLRRLRRAADNVNAALFGSHCDRDDEHLGKRIADAARRRIGDMNATASAFWAKRSATAQPDSSGRMHWRGGDAASGARSTAFRDAMHSAAHAATPREQIAALNRGARAFWSGTGEPPTLVADALRGAPAPTSVSEINARNRAFWAAR